MKKKVQKCIPEIKWMHHIIIIVLSIQGECSWSGVCWTQAPISRDRGIMIQPLQILIDQVIKGRF